MPIQTEEKIKLILTLPKSGTHLLKKVLPLILNRDPSVLYFTNIDQSPFKPPYVPDDQKVIFNHVYPGFDLYRKYPSSKLIKVLLIRDPRDAVVSFMNWLPRSQQWGPWTPKEVIQDFNVLPQDERLSKSILFPDKYLGVSLFCKKAIEWMEDPKLLVCRFEDMIGPEGGGDRAKQKETIKALAAHLEVSLSEDRINFITDNLFGGTFTFHQGKIGSWRSHFKDYHKDLFKKALGNELQKLGYEKNHRW